LLDELGESGLLDRQVTDLEPADQVWIWIESNGRLSK
jgi:hypothetical protein